MQSLKFFRRTMSTAWNDFRSDTFTTPTKSMLDAINKATHGDDVYQEDKTTNDFQERICKLTGKPASLFVVSGTMGNQLCLRVHLRNPPQSALCDYRSHVYCWEAGGIAAWSGSQVSAVRPENGTYHITCEDVINNVILGDDIHTCPTRVISLENTLQGTVLPIKEIEKISKFAHENNIALHLDGARIWDASVASNASIKEICSHFDSVSLCLSKGLGAPIGSIIVGSNEFIEKARHFRKQMGGGIRQAGLLTAAANVALDEVLPKFPEIHKKTIKTAEYLNSKLGIQFQFPVQTNFIFLDLKKSNIPVKRLVEECEKEGIKVMGGRLAFHHQITDEAIEKLIKALTTLVDESKKSNSNGILNLKNSASAHHNGHSTPYGLYKH